MSAPKIGLHMLPQICIPISSMWPTVYLPTWMVDSYGTYTLDAMGYSSSLKILGPNLPSSSSSPFASIFSEVNSLLVLGKSLYKPYIVGI